MPQNLHKKQLFRQLVPPNLSLPHHPRHNLQPTAHNLQTLQLLVGVPQTELKEKVPQNPLFLLQILQNQHPHNNPPRLYLRVIISLMK
jgi:hypothetical protein